MPILDILQFPDPRLRIEATPVEKIDDIIVSMVADMFETMYKHHGLGLAATQVNIHKRIFVMDVSETRDQRICVINPKIIHREGVQIDHHGCLSVGAGISDKIKRAAKLTLQGLDLEGKNLELQAEGVMAICIQHEIDHLNGMLFIHHLSRLKQDRIAKKLEKFKRSEG